MSRPERFAELLRRVTTGVLRLERDEVCCGDFTLRQFETLRAVRDGGGATTGALAEALGIDLSTASRGLARLERDGYVHRARAEADARCVAHRLTPKGARALETLHCDRRDVLAAALLRVPPSERAAVLDALEAVATALEPKRATAEAASPPPGNA